MLPATTKEQALATLMMLETELLRRRPFYRKFDDYYRGRHPLVFASDQFSDYFGDRYKDFADNWIQVVADAPVERLSVSGLRLFGEDSGYDDELWGVWQENDCDEQSDLAFLEAVINGRSAVLVWGDDDGNPVVTWEHPAQTVVAYDHGTRKRNAGLKLWTDETYAYATLYMPDTVWKFQSKLGPDYDPIREFGGPFREPVWVPRTPAQTGDETWPLVNPLGVVPLVELQNRPRLVAPPMSDVNGAIAMQDAINLLWSYLLNAADFASLGQRIVLGAEQPMQPILDDNGQPVGEKPVDLKQFALDRVLWIEDPNAKIGQWSAANLEPFDTVTTTMVRHIAAQTRTPTHYFEQMANLAADALKAAEVGLVKRTEEKTVSFGKTVREVNRLAALVAGDTAKAKAVARGTVLWRDIESRSDAQLVDSLLKLKQLGMPFEYICERLGLSPSEIERIMDLRQQEAQSDPLALLAQVNPMDGANGPSNGGDASQVPTGSDSEVGA